MCTFVHICVYVGHHTSIHLYTNVYMHIYLYIYIYMFILAYMPLSLSLSIYIYIHVCERTQNLCPSLRQPVGRFFTNLNRLILAVTEDL